MSEGFTYVSRPRKSRRNKAHKAEEPSLESIKDRFETTQSQFIVSDFCAQCLSIVLLRCSMTLVAYQKILEDVVAPERIVCLGLGSLVVGEARSKRISEVQLALLLQLNEDSKVLPLVHRTYIDSNNSV
jgi:SRR1